MTSISPKKINVSVLEYKKSIVSNQIQNDIQDKIFKEKLLN